MTYLDCHDLRTMLISVSAAIDRTPDKLADALRSYDDEARPRGEDPWTYTGRAALSSISVELETVTFEGTHWFHGTRTVDPSRFSTDGLLPLPMAVDRLWNDLYGLVEKEIGHVEWETFRRSIETDGGGHFADLYRHKLSSPLDQGPQAELVRDVLLNPDATTSHDYLGTPEIVEDISLEATDALGVNLLDRFVEVATPCLIKFRTATCQPGALEAALFYGREMLTDGQIGGRGACHAYSGMGIPISPRDVLCTEIIAR